MLKDRLRDARLKNKLSQKQLADMSGVTQSVIAQMESGRNKKSAHILDIAKSLNVSPEWLVDGTTASMVFGNDDDIPVNDVDIPFISQAWSIDGESTIEAVRDRIVRFPVHDLKNKGINPESVICYRLAGDYMSPVIPNGSILAIDQDQKNII